MRWCSPGRCAACENFSCVSPKVDDIEHLPASDWGKPWCSCSCHDVPCKRCGSVGGHYCTGKRSEPWCNRCRATQYPHHSSCDLYQCEHCGVRLNWPVNPGHHLVTCPLYVGANIADILRDLVAPKCKKHRQYKALRRPRTACEACWRQWIAKNP